jgi:hypothetical protein
MTGGRGNKSFFAAFFSKKEDPPRSGQAHSCFFEKKAVKKLLFPARAER